MARSLESLFKPKPPRVVQDAVLGALCLKDKEWHFRVSVGSNDIHASIPDVKGSPCEEARNVAASSAGEAKLLWKAAVDYTVAQMTPLSPRFKVEASEFALEAVSFHAPGAFEGGEVVFWFRIAGDKDGSYFVPLHSGTPLLWHRDS